MIVFHSNQTIDKRYYYIRVITPKARLKGPVVITAAKIKHITQATYWYCLIYHTGDFSLTSKIATVSYKSVKFGALH